MNDVSSGKAEAKVPPVPRHGIESWFREAKGYRVAFAKASVYQERNVHDLVRDMRQEYLGYENNLDLAVDLARDPESIAAYPPGRSLWARTLYRRHFAHA